MGSTAAGAAIGAGVGALGGAAIGNSMDQEEARNRALIAQQLGRQVDPGAVSISDVIAMKRANVTDELVINHIHAHGMVAPLQTNDLINLPQQGVSSQVIAAMQESPPRTCRSAAARDRRGVSSPVLRPASLYRAAVPSLLVMRICPWASSGIAIG